MIAEPQGSARVVVVDDDRLLRELVRDAIGERAHVECCESAEVALAALARQPADLVVSDLNMPGLSGSELLERIRRDHPDTDFVLLTGHASVESAVGALRMGAADYLVKPVRSEELGLVVDRVLARRRLLAENERLRDELRAVDSCRTLMGCLEPGEIYAVTLDLLLATLSCERGVALFRRPSVPTSDGVAFRGFGESEVRRLRSVLVSDKPFDLETYDSLVLVSEGELHDALRELDIACGSTLLVPIRGRETEVGVIWLFVGEGGLDGGLLERTRLVAGHAELALHNAERYHHAKERAFVDDVTDVYNARFLLQATERELQRSERYEKELSVLFLDLDRFKLVNDRYGHLAGSEVLRRLSRVLQDCIRQVDTLARYGGDEFTVLLADTGGEEAMVIAERIRRTVEETLFEGGRGTPIRLTISIGVATYPQHATDRDSLLDTADKAMYRAKSLGRNCCCSASDL
ncbi:MAG: diguanylate cyclase [Deltaproteobacteria bacterium]|nr:diguanylate cyclase [Deltaproteobacteria bacterium]